MIELSTELIENIKNYKILGHGNISTCYEIDLETVVLERSGNQLSFYAGLQEKHEQLKAIGIPVPKIHSIREHNGKTYICEEKVPGKTLESFIPLSQGTFVNNIEMTHIKKFISDLYQLMAHGVIVDPSNLGNYLYSADFGFSFIDLGYYQTKTPSRYNEAIYKSNTLNIITRILMLNMKSDMLVKNSVAYSMEEKQAMQKIVTALIEVSLEDPDCGITIEDIKSFFSEKSNQFDVDLSRIDQILFRRDILSFENEYWMYYQKSLENTEIPKPTGGKDVFLKIASLQLKADTYECQKLDFETERKNIDILIGKIMSVLITKDSTFRKETKDSAIHMCKELGLNFSAVVNVAKHIMTHSIQEHYSTDMFAKVFEVDKEQLEVIFSELVNNENLISDADFENERT